MALHRAPLGQRGSYLATGLNVLQCLGWSVFEITVIAIAAGALSQRLLGVHLIWMWKLVFGALGLVLALLGPVGFVRRYVRKIGIWAVAASIVYLAVWIIQHGHVGKLWHAGGHGGSFWLGVDLVIALTVSWVPLVADYTRFSRSRAGCVRRRGARLPPADALPVRLRRDPRALAPVDLRADGRAHDRRRRRRRLGPRAARAHRRRDRRGVREHLLDRRLAAELSPARVAAAADRRRRGRSRRRSRSASTSRSTSSSSCCSARSSCRSSACCSPTGSSRAATTRASDIFGGPLWRPGMIAVVDRRLLPLRVDRADAGARLLVAAASRSSIRPTAGSARRCRASPSRSCWPPPLRFPAVRPLGVIGHLSRDIVAGAAPRIGGGPWYAGPRAARARRRRGALREVRRRRPRAVAAEPRGDRPARVALDRRRDDALLLLLRRGRRRGR